MTTTPINFSADFQGRPFGERGNILIYVLMTMVIFAVIGVTMVSLFSTSVSSSATANETRRAFYLSESGIRYAISELRQGGFSATNVNRINANPFSVPPAGSFRVTVLGAWFQSPSNQNVAGGTLAVELEKGRIPTGFSARLNSAVPDLYLVVAGLDPRSTTQTPNANEVANVNSFTASSDTAGSFDIADQLVVGRDKRICLAVQPRAGADQSFTPSAGGSAGSLELRQRTAAVFPKTDGSFLFAGKAYFYRSAVEDTANGVFRLNDISAGPNVTNAQVTVTAADYILLAPNNYFVTSKGTTSGNVEFGGDMDHAAALASHSAADLSEPDLAVGVGDVVQIESGSSFLGEGTDTQGDYLQIGPSAGMGAMWYNQNLYLGGSTNYCTSGPDVSGRRGCFFESGMRAFFTLEYSGTGDGLIYALMNGQLNQFNSAGGDFEATELLGYAGDSRTNNSGGFLDTTGVKGLRPPKMALEFDTRRNWDSTFEAKPTDYCSGSSLKQNTRNDPDPASAAKDFVQYVYWGNTSEVNVPCRTTPSDRSSTYDDNRHNPGASPTGDWFQPLTGLVNTSASVSADGRTVYVATNNSDTNPTSGRLYFIDLDAQGNVSSVSTWGPAANGVTSPVLDRNGNIYVGAGNQLRAFRPDRLEAFPPVNLSGGTRASSPVIGPDGTIYVSVYDGVNFGRLYAIDPDGSLKSSWSNNPQIIQFFNTAPVLTSDGSLVIAATNSQRVYALKTSDGLPDLNWGLTGIFLPATPRNAPGIGPGLTAKGTVYVAASDRRVYALSGEDGSLLLTSSAFASEGLSTQPVVSGGTVYVGSFDDNLYALNTSDLSPKAGFPFFAAGNVQSTPVVDSNGHVYFGSDIRDPFVDNRNVNVLYPDGTVKWQFSTGSGDVRGTPAVRPDGTVYIGSFNFNLYAINQFAVPKSLKDKFITYDTGAVGAVPVSVDSADNWLQGSSTRGPWAVRMEVYRSTSPNASAPVGYYSYLLRTWVRQCQQAGCSDVIGSYYDDTHLTYSPALRPPQMEQAINLSATENTQFQRFIFGFTSQTASGDNQQSVIRELKLSFVRPTDPTVTCDPNWPEATTCP